jgi:TolB-like protein
MDVLRGLAERPLSAADLAGREDFRLGETNISPSTRTVAGPGGSVDVEPRVMQVLMVLADAAGHVVTRDRLFERCWGGVYVGDDSLNRVIGRLRKVASEIADGSFVIETIPRTGYRLNGATAAGEPPTIAVLPFSNEAGDPAQDYFVEGMLDEIVAALTRIRALLVISNESSSALKGTGWDEQQAAARMGVRYLLKGSVRRSGVQIRIAARLIDTSRGVQIWAERFDYELKDLFELQDRIALEVAAAIEPSIYEAEVRRAARQPIENLGCYDLYLHAAPLRSTCRRAEVEQALELLDRALALDPTFAPALAQAAGCHSQIYENGWGEDLERHRIEGLTLADRALMCGAEDATVLAQVANALMDLEGNVARATALADRAIAVNSGCARAWFISGLAHLMNHEGAVAIERLEVAARLDPISPLNDLIRTHIGVGHFVNGDYRRALEEIRATSHRTLRIHLTLAALYGYLGMAAESEEEVARFRSKSPLSPEEMIAIGIPTEQSRALLLEGLSRGRKAVRLH